MVFVMVALAGCAAVGADYVQPEAALPDAWEEPLDEGLQATPYELAA
jgi:hypothetical protein